ncbi:hypothetical protein PoB_007245000 [Plakobranchus ocellatus]|uniref:Uncharacterized protein n=1 Tax=Plakobranchus ocellatus TaxID=259542 RepID=A0AAV4DPF5_9GAST|nr:hypothetical protein PoB_007245000 [Plakobranchus ocellatus]
MKFENEEDFEVYICRLKALPKRVLQVIDILKEGVEKGVVQFPTSVERVPKQIEIMLTTSNLDDLDLLKPFKEKPKNISQDQL